MAEEIKIVAPQVLKVTNNTNRSVTFVPYRENFTTALAAGATIEFTADTAGQILYYLKQSVLTVKQLTNFEEASDNVKIIKTPAKMLITNTSKVTKAFVPYKENFTIEVKSGDSYNITVKTLGQVLYYLAQATDGLTVEIDETI